MSGFAKANEDFRQNKWLVNIEIKNIGECWSGGFCSEVVLSATWNAFRQLSKKKGLSLDFDKCQEMISITIYSMYCIYTFKLFCDSILFFKSLILFIVTLFSFMAS